MVNKSLYNELSISVLRLVLNFYSSNSHRYNKLTLSYSIGFDCNFIAMAGNCFCTMVGAVGVALIGFFWYGMMIDSSQITSIETQIKEKLPAHFQDFTSFVNYTVSELGDFQTVSTELQKMIDATVGEDCDTFKCPES